MVRRRTAGNRDSWEWVNAHLHATARLTHPYVRLQTDKIGDTTQPVILRIAATSYMASFLVRHCA
jgi:hypothetical protein